MHEPAPSGATYLLSHLLSSSVRAHPEKCAVEFEGEALSYHQLDEVTNRLAWALAESGVQRGDRLGLLINKSIPAIVAIHAILKTGAAYVPLDPSAPPARIAYIIGNCGIRCLLTSTRKAGSLRQCFPEDSPLETVVVTDDAGEVPEVPARRVLTWSSVMQHESTPPPDHGAIGTDLAYVLYTSGSTGVPKGVMISHLNALTFVNWAHDAIGVISSDRLSNHAPLHFDLSVFDVFVASKAGATLVPVPEGKAMFPVRMADWILNRRISVWYSVPSVLSMMAMKGKLGPNAFPDLRAVLFAGETFPVKYARRFMELVPHATYYNLYGPTETNVVTYYRVPNPLPEEVGTIPIGRACGNMEVFALTEDGALVARPGQEGELFARGSCVALGYWGDGEKTARSFVANPRPRGFEETVYKTGDIVKIDDDGQYVYVGRSDHMIKSRGYRIELGEIEAALYDHAHVKEAAAVPVADELIGNRIEAFVALNAGAEVTPSDLKEFCARRIPSYMVPERVVLLDSLPRTSTGKVDRRALADFE